MRDVIPRVGMDNVLDTTITEAYQKISGGTERREEGMNEKQSICQSCGCIGRPIKVGKGSFSTELALWYLCILPGFIYAIWRYFSRYDACPRCKQPSMVPVDTPRGQELLSAQDHGKRKKQGTPVTPDETKSKTQDP